jgi:hypothetical protein
MNDGASKPLQYPSEVLRLRGGMNTSTGDLGARMHDRMYHHRHHLACGAPKAKAVEGRFVIQIRTDANHSGQ